MVVGPSDLNRSSLAATRKISRIERARRVLLCLRHPSWPTQAWLKPEALIVDFTGDQFSDDPVAVFVGRNSRWHAQFRFDSEHPADIDRYDPNTPFSLGIAYRYILRNLK